ncbi:hypothetical protein A3860_36880 [Niastella vici]|uniref:Uncharacterized protein n=1 Tax=Niastella vici TaxID=1703345 RepID=A0A1V9FMK3_9BACT|nr:FecR family protein [Niastella vici]OQP59568.1 hypothetical protein A3860_36880 [Niastella vici]
MLKKYEHLAELILKTWRGETNDQEKAELQKWLDADTKNRELIKNFRNLDWVIGELKELQNTNEIEAEKVLSRIVDEDKEAIYLGKRATSPPVKTSNRLFTKWKWVAAAAVVVTIVGVKVFNAHNKPPVNNNNAPEISQRDSSQTPVPGTEKAILTLANGRRFVIEDTMANGYLTAQHNLVFSNKNGMIICTETLRTGEKQPLLQFHTLETPRGATYGLVLPDGSKVWLNSESRIRFPSVFTGNERLVELEGEAFFEVAHEPQHFIVKAKGAEIRVTGTRFNVFAHTGNKMAKVTLIEGQLSVWSGERAAPVAPEQSAVFANGIMPVVNNEPDMTKILAWRNNQFLFEKDSLTSALEEIARWYNLEIVYEYRPAIILNYFKDFRNRPIDTLIDNLTAGCTNVHFKRIGMKLYVRK